MCARTAPTERATAIRKALENRDTAELRKLARTAPRYEEWSALRLVAAIFDRMAEQAQEQLRPAS